MTLYHEQQGQGPAVVLVHGWGSHGGIWRDVAHTLSHNYSVTVPDLPGHGRSRNIRLPEYTPENLVDSIRTATAGAPSIWVGWSLGGLLALVAAARYPQEVTRLVLVGATPKYVQAPDWREAMSPTVLDQFTRNLAQDYPGTLERFLTLQMAAGEDRNVLRRLREEMFRYGEAPVDTLLQGLELLKNEDRRAQVSGITSPTLILHGDRDRFVPLKAAQYLAAHIPNARLDVFAGSGHAPFLSHPEQFVQKLKDFIHG